MPNNQTPISSFRELCGKGNGVFTRADALEHNLSLGKLRSFVDQGVFVREAPGIYRLGGPRLTERQSLRVAVSDTDGVVSHVSAARYWGWSGGSAMPVHVTVDRNVSRVSPIPWVAVHSSRRSLAGRFVQRSGLPILSVPWTLLDIAASGTEWELQDFLDHCLSQRLVKWEELQRVVTAKRGVAGIGPLRRLVLEGSLHESKLEAKMLRVLREGHVPKPVTQYALRDQQGGVLARLDAAWPQFLVGAEADGYGPHSSVRQFVRDRERSNQVIALGWTLLHTTWRQLEDTPWQFVADIKAALGRAAGAAS